MTTKGRYGQFGGQVSSVRSRSHRIADRIRGYLYLVAVLGVTEVRDQVSYGAIDLLHRVRNHTHLPLGLGFGISTPAHAQTCAGPWRTE